MSNVLLKLLAPSLSQQSSSSLALSVRHGHHLRGKPPGVARTLQQRLEEINYKDPSLHYKVDIGLPPPQIPKKALLNQRLEHMKSRKDTDLERLARNHNLFIDLEKCNSEWLKTVGPQHIRRIAEHYGVFEHLFGDAYFNPQVPLEIFYVKDNVKCPVHYGNILKPEDAALKPELTFESDDSSLWTLVLTNPDGHFQDNDKEYVHWFVANIPGNKVDKGEVIINYLQPFPPKGTGYHRYIFILYKQNRKLDFSKYKKSGLCHNLSDRTFKTYDFYKSLQDDITPAGLALFQSDWSPSVKQFYHEVLDMGEPIFEYDFPAPYIRPQQWFPKRRPFNLYMDKYRDPKQINKEFLLRKLKEVHPFKAPPAPLPYPNASYIEKDVPTWLKLEIRKSWLKWGRINDIEKN
ncbi:large ribosomal subunit protein mL38 [Euwallacea fornicatus]|uniref:large ribosomal subunit protein mL38 n=1 Tax=Euwallacea fornicatus TaxID=995702 RepID=UPI0033904ACB